MRIDGTVVIGEGERDKAPMLFIGEKIGIAGPEGVAGPRIFIMTETIVLRSVTGTVRVIRGQHRKPEKIHL
jgi:fructose-1,6-bisphosphatase/sedoheptulose 1,7-bisphosphatase-like protein